jgi:hypothetical protein
MSIILTPDSLKTYLDDIYPFLCDCTIVQIKIMRKEDEYGVSFIVDERCE